jgi:hypothetical protein
MVARNEHPLAAGVALGALILIFFGMFWLRWGRDLSMPGIGWLEAVCLVVLSGVLHELLHAAALVFVGKVSWRSLALRRTWRKMGIVVESTASVSARAQRVSLLLPAIILGFVPAAIAIAAGSGLLMLWSAFCLLECYADFSEAMDPERHVVDLPRAEV